MATAHAPSTVLQDNYLEPYCLFWLDPSKSEIKDPREAQKRLRKSFNHITMLNSVNICEQHIRSVPEDDHIILIVHGQLAREIIPRIHSLRQVFSIYIYSMEKKRNDEWIKEFQKVNDRE